MDGEKKEKKSTKAATVRKEKVPTEGSRKSSRVAEKRRIDRNEEGGEKKRAKK